MGGSREDYEDEDELEYKLSSTLSSTTTTSSNKKERFSESTVTLASLGIEDADTKFLRRMQKRELKLIRKHEKKKKN